MKYFYQILFQPVFCLLAANLVFADPPYDQELVDFSKYGLRVKHFSDKDVQDVHSVLSGVYDSNYLKAPSVHAYNPSLGAQPFTACLSSKRFWALPESVQKLVLGRSPSLPDMRIVFQFINPNEANLLRPHYYMHPTAQMKGTTTFQTLTEGAIVLPNGQVKNVSGGISTHPGTGNITVLSPNNLAIGTVPAKGMDFYSVTTDVQNPERTVVTYHWLMPNKLSNFVADMAEKSFTLGAFIGNLGDVDESWVLRFQSLFLDVKEHEWPKVTNPFVVPKVMPSISRETESRTVSVVSRTIVSTNGVIVKSLAPPKTDEIVHTVVTPFKSDEHKMRTLAKRKDLFDVGTFIKLNPKLLEEYQNGNENVKTVDEEWAHERFIQNLLDGEGLPFVDGVTGNWRQWLETTDERVVKVKQHRNWTKLKGNELSFGIWVQKVITGVETL